MTRINRTKSKRLLSAKLAAGLAISAFLVFGTFVATAGAQDRHGDEHHDGDHHDNRGHDRDHHDNRGHDRWGHSYYRAPPVVYGSPYYAAPYGYPPPVVYAPGVGVYLPGFSLNIR